MGGGRGAGRVARREAGDAVYGIYHAGGLAEVVQDQRAGAGQWRYLGTWAFDPAGSPLVVLAGGSDGTLSADAIRFVGAGPAPAALRFVHNDHLGTPQKLTDNTGTLVWDRIQTPFGLDHSVTGPAATPVRFPGQYADGESALHYNYFRDYDPSLGCYVQSDPIGLKGGLNLFSYANENSIVAADFYGLSKNGPPPTFDPKNLPKPPKTISEVGQPDPIAKPAIRATCERFLFGCTQKCRKNRAVRICKKFPPPLGNRLAGAAMRGVLGDA